MSGSILFFAMPEHSHFLGLLPIVAGVARRGVRAVVFTDRRYAQSVRAAGGEPVDVFEDAPLAAVDGESRPVPCRYVSFAGAQGHAVAKRAAAFDPSLVIYDTFAPVGRVVAHALRLPYVNVCGGHDVDPERTIAELRTDPRVAVAPPCHRAVERLRDRHGWPDASPFAYVTGLSPFLNLYPEPPEFLPRERHGAFAPIAFFGSLPDPATQPPAPAARAFLSAGDALRIYASFGTVVWRYFAEEALAALRAVRAHVVGRSDRELLVSLGGAEAPTEAAASLAAPNVRVVPFADQWNALAEADAFVTHHGLRSTHEAIHQRCPMLSMPFFWDQPRLAARCAELGLALPLGRAPRRAPDPEAIDAALARIAHDRSALAPNLEQARSWELVTLANRESILDRLLTQSWDA